MKVFILMDENNVVRCMATEEVNLHQDKLDTMTKLQVEAGGLVGDKYDSDKKEWTSQPANYPEVSDAEAAEVKIAQETRRMAIDSLKAKGELPQDFNG